MASPGVNQAVGLDKDSWVDLTDISGKNCDVGGGFIDISRFLLLIPNFNRAVPPGVFVVSSIGSVFNVVGGSINVKDGINLVKTAKKTEWTFGQRLGLTKIGAGISLFLGGLVSIPQRIFQVLHALSAVAVAKAELVLGVLGSVAMGAYLSMFLFVDVCCVFFLFKEQEVRKSLNELAGNSNEGFLKSIGEDGKKANVFWSSLKKKVEIPSNGEEKIHDGKDNASPIEDISAQHGSNDEWRRLNSWVKDLTVFGGGEVMNELKKKNEQISDENALAFCKKLHSKLQEKRIFFVVLLVASVVASAAMIGALFLTFGAWPIILMVLFIGLTVVFCCLNIKGLKMAFVETREKKSDRAAIVFFSTCIILLTGVAIVLSLNPVSLAWILVIAGLGLVLMTLQAVLWLFINQKAGKEERNGRPLQANLQPV